MHIIYFTVNISFFYVAGDLAGRPGTPTFVCTPGENIELDALCDGVRDCTNGDDENSTLCESMSTNKTYYFLVVTYIKALPGQKNVCDIALW